MVMERIKEPDDVEVNISVNDDLLFPVEVDGDGRVHTRDWQGDIPQFRRIKGHSGQSGPGGEEQVLLGTAAARNSVRSHFDAGRALAREALRLAQTQVRAAAVIVSASVFGDVVRLHRPAPTKMFFFENNVFP